MPRKKKKSPDAVPLAVIKRLPLYHRYLTMLAQNDVERISSRELAAKMGITASQLRQDLSWFGSFGQQGYGYRVKDLLGEVSKILGLDRQFQMIILGAGNLARALVSYPNFRRRGFYVEAIFDSNPDLIGKQVNGVTIKDVKYLSEYLQQHTVDIGIITAPASVAQKLADTLVAGGVKAIWNFAPIHLKVPRDVVVENVQIGESLLTLSFRLQQQERRKS